MAKSYLGRIDSRSYYEGSAPQVVLRLEGAASRRDTEVSEAIVGRARAIARAYALPVLSDVDLTSGVRISDAEAEELASETSFLLSVTRDPLLSDVLDVIRALALARLGRRYGSR